MKTIRTAIFLIAGVVFQNAFSQSDFKPGYLISLEGDTLKGQIDYRGDIKNAIQCVFRTNEMAEPVICKPADIRAYRFTEGKFYISKTVLAGTDSLRLFIEFLVDGIANLFYYKDKVGEHYLIEKNDGRIVEMKNEDKEIEIEGQGKYLFNPKNYIGILNAVFSDCHELHKPIMESELNHKSLIGIVKDYHSYVCKDEACIVYEKKMPFVRAEFAPYMACHIAGIRYASHTEYASMEFEKSTTPSLGVIMNIIMPSFNERLSLQLDTEAGDYYFYFFKKIPGAGETEYADYHIHTFYLRSIASMRYTYPTGKFRPVTYIGVGLHSVLLNKSKRVSEIETGSVVKTNEYNDIPVDYMSPVLNGAIGINYHLNKKIIIFLALQYNLILGSGYYTIHNGGIKAGIYL